MSQSSQPTFVPIPSSQLGGAIAVNIFAVLATVALVSVVLRVSWLAIRRTFFKSCTDARECVFFHTQLGHYAACLIIALMSNAVAGIIGIQWYFQGGIVDGRTCRSQAFITQIGNFSSAYFTTAIAVHTFNSLVMRRRQSVIICRSTIIIGWVWSGLMAGAPFLIHGADGYVYGADGLACGVRPVYPKSQFLFHLLPILIASTLGTILYSLIFLVLRGTLKIRSGIKLTLNPNERWTGSEDLGVDYHRFIARIARSMLWYPVAYVVLLVPYAVTRLFGISGFKVPFEAVLFASACWYSLCVVDVLLLYNTFRVLGPAFDTRSAASTRFSSFGTAGELEKNTPSTHRSEMQEKIHQYRAQSLGSRSSSENSRSSSSQGLLPLYLGRDERIHESDYSYSNASMVGRPITPAGFNYDITVPPPAVSPIRKTSRDFGEYSRNDSSTSIGLPAPPRRNRSPVLSQLMLEPRNSPSAQAFDAESWMDRQRSTQTFGHQDTPPERSPSLMSEWSSRHLAYDNRSPGFNNSGQTSFGSAVMASSYPNPTLPRSPLQSSLDRSLSATSTYSPPPSRGPRPLLLPHSSNSLDSMNNHYRSGPGIPRAV
ncbi:hypothetical protein M413DRAFT_189985 [Hebeloma cylindrosporum]|uniref:G-protein coupled receptors family 1 profile domain-containing protein n=1 Tax=Hebeloma cylindrosporum TaxID=76867 RepID=A0A0C3BTL2_HEBCY|nr:hypothetical protein M413DRAFT_189985 [Hebeloma cylindrosporum h7]